MHDTSKIGSFMALRANGWSLAKISKELNISKSTLWEWDNKQQNEIHLLKHLQLEKLQEKYLPTYEEELSKLRSYLDRLEVALEDHDFTEMGPEYVLQMALQLRARLGKMREQVPLRNVPFNEPLTPLPFTGCVSRQNVQDFREEYFAGESHEDAPSDSNGIPSEPRTSVSLNAVQSEPRTSVSDPSPAPHKGVPINGNGNGKPHANGNGHANTNGKAHPTNPTDPPLHELGASGVNPAQPNRTFPDETPPGSKKGTLNINGFHKPDPNGRPVLNSQNSHLNSHLNAVQSEPRTSVSDPSPAPQKGVSINGNGNGNGKPHANGNGHANANGKAHPTNTSNSSLRELRASVVNPPQPSHFQKGNYEQCH